MSVQIETSRSPRYYARQLLAVIVSVAVVITAVITTSAAGAAEDTDTSGQCPAVHMLLAPGTSETSRSSDPNTDSHGFLSDEVATPVMDAANVGQIADLGAGFSDLLKQPGEDNDGKINTSEDSASSGASGSSSSGSSAQSSQDSDDPVQRVARTYITYPSTAGGFWAGMGVTPGTPKNFGDTTSYEDSVAEGINMTEDLISKISVDCPDTKVFLTGYSQGAEVMSGVARRAGAEDSSVDPDAVAGVSLFADPTRSGGTGLNAGGTSSPGPVPDADGDAVSQTVTGMEEMTTPDARGLSTDKTGIEDFGELSDRVASWCLMGDYVCGLPADSELTNDITTILEQVSAADPVQTLRQLGDVMDRAAKVGDVSEVADFSYGEDGFDTEATDTADTPVLTQRVASQKDAAEQPDDSGEQGAARDTTQSAPKHNDSSATSSPSETPSAQPGAESESSQSEDTSSTSSDSADSENSTSSQSSTSTSTEPSASAPSSGEAEPSGQQDDGVDVPGLGTLPGPPDAPDVPEIPGAPGAAETINDGLDKAVPIAAGLGGMALGAGITVAKKTLTPQNIAEVAQTGVTAGPEAAGGTALAKLTESGMSLLEPGSASGYARDVLELLDDNDVPVANEAKLAVNLSAWTSLTEHTAYGERAMLPDGRSAAEATTDWVEAIASDLTADTDTPMDTDHLTDAVTGGLSVLREVDFDDEMASAAADTARDMATQ